MTCQKCRNQFPAHERWDCVGCRLTLCYRCVEPLRNIHQPIRCHECAVLARQREQAERLKRLGR